MRSFLPFLAFVLLITSCQSDKPDYWKMIQGNWEYSYVKSGDTTNLKVYFSGNICHLMYGQDNIDTFCIKNDSIEIRTFEEYAIDYPFSSHILKIIRVNKNVLEVCSLKGGLNNRLGVLRTDTLKFVKIKKKNDFRIRRISFYSSGGNGCLWPSFKAEMNSDHSVKFEGYSCSDFEGTYLGKSSPGFWNLLKDKVGYIDFNNWKEKHEVQGTDHESCTLVFETSRGVYKTYIYGHGKEPMALRNIINYIYSNYDSFDVKKISGVKLRFHHEKQIREFGVLPRQKPLPFLIPN